MTILYIWITFCVGFISGASWAGIHNKKEGVDRYFSKSSAQWAGAKNNTSSTPA